MSTITIATFNCENLFRRFKFRENLSSEKIRKALQNGFIFNKPVLKTITQNERKLTAKAIKATKADIVCLQEVENMDTLRNFLSVHLPRSGYKYSMLIDAKDPRLIDVALISKIPFSYVKTHQYYGNSKIFSRDCLEVEFDINGKPLTIFINHFKSMYERSNKTPAEKRALTTPKRQLQSQTVLDIIQQKYKYTPQNSNWIVLGDLNDYPDETTGVKKLLDSRWMENVIQTRITDAGEQWTHFRDTKEVPVDDRYKQIDYLFLSKKLATSNPAAVPVIIRKGLVTKATKYTGARFNGVTEKQGASDHCPVAITLNL